MFDRSLADRTYFFLPNLHPHNHLFPFGSIILNKTTQIASASADLKSVTLSKLNSILKIIQMDNQYNFCWLGVIPALQVHLC